MAQVIRNIKAGQKFEVVEMNIGGFDTGCIIEALDNIDNVKDIAGEFKWIGGVKPIYIYDDENITLTQKTIDLKRYRGKIK